MFGPHTGSHPRILLVESDAVAAYAIGHDLRAAGVEVLVAHDGRAALGALTNEILTLDLLVTGMDVTGLVGLDLIRVVRGAGGETDLPILAMADEWTRGLEAKLLAYGAVVVRKDEGVAVIVAAALRLLMARGWFQPDAAAPEFEHGAARAVLLGRLG